jgi:hypothetical protein
MKAIDFSVGFIRDFLKHRANAIRTVEEIKRGEWEPIYNTRHREHLHAERYGICLSMDGGFLGCKIYTDDWWRTITRNDQNLGLWGWYVWFKAARQLKVYADRYVNSTI